MLVDNTSKKYSHGNMAGLYVKVGAVGGRVNNNNVWGMMARWTERGRMHVHQSVCQEKNVMQGGILRTRCEMDDFVYTSTYPTDILRTYNYPDIRTSRSS